MPTDHPTPSVLHLDSRGLQVLAHPLRSRLLTALRTGGPATATALAANLETNTGATSYHLRKLAGVGLVVETGEGRGRERWWRAATEMHNWSDRDLAGDPDGQAASAWLRHQYLRHFVEQAERWLDHRDSWPLEWRAVSGASDYLLEISADRLGRLLEELRAVVDGYREAEPGEPRGERPVATDGASTPDGPTERVALSLYAHPMNAGPRAAADDHESANATGDNR